MTKSKKIIKAWAVMDIIDDKKLKLDGWSGDYYIFVKKSDANQLYPNSKIQRVEIIIPIIKKKGKI